MSSLLQAFHDLKPQRIEIGKFYPAFVVDNNDMTNHPDKLPLGRVKFRIPILFDEIDDQYLPWAVPIAMRCNCGDDNGQFHSPKIGTKIIVEFQANDIYNPFYMCYPFNKDEQLKTLTDDPEDKQEYPKKSVVYNFESGNSLTVRGDYKNEEQKNKVEQKNVGNKQETCEKDYQLDVKRDMKVEVKDKYQFKTTPTKTEKTVKNNYTSQYNQKYEKNILGDELKQVQGKSNQIYQGKSTQQYSNGLSLKADGNGLIVETSDGSVVRISPNGISIDSKSPINLNGRNVNVSASGQLNLQGSQITKSTEINFSNGVRTMDVISDLIDSKLEAQLAVIRQMIDSAVSSSESRINARISALG